MAPQRQMKRRAGRAAHAMDRPWPALLAEGAVVRRMPVARGDDENAGAGEQRGAAVQRRNHRVAVAHRQHAAGAEVVLHVHNHQRTGTIEANLHAGVN